MTKLEFRALLKAWVRVGEKSGAEELYKLVRETLEENEAEEKK